MDVVGLIARGGFGRVERVRLEGGAVVARKVFDPSPQASFLDQTKLRRRFVHEVEALRRLATHGVIPVLDAALDAEPPWFTMPLAEKSFRAQVQADRAAGVVSPEPLADILNALEEVHRLGYVHRDLKPENILFLDGAWLLADFGLVGIPQGAGEARLTSTSTGWATAAYCAPEQAIDFKNVDQAADIYAMGCILHDIVGSGPRVPFQTHTAKGPLGAIVARCTQADPRQRWKSVGALRSALLDAIRRSSAGDPSAEVESWHAALARLHEWDPDKLGEFVAYVEEEDRAVCALLDEERLAEIHGIDPVAWRRIARVYCAYARGRFEFAECDVVTSRLLEIFELGDVEVRAAAAMSAAVLGSSHNRWFALKKVVALCGPGLGVDVAERLAIDVRAEEQEEVFRRCAELVSKPVTIFHAALVRVLEDQARRQAATVRVQGNAGKGTRPAD
jgi:tRNA A-37 threonylcarbamoyl transferase component Bud32